MALLWKLGNSSGNVGSLTSEEKMYNEKLMETKPTHQGRQRNQTVVFSFTGYQKKPVEECVKNVSVAPRPQ